MREIKAKRDERIYDEEYIPVMEDGGRMVCCCGFELIKQDEDTYRCTGGSHVYKLSEGDVIQDKFGNMMVRPYKQEG